MAGQHEGHGCQAEGIERAVAGRERHFDEISAVDEVGPPEAAI